MAINRKVVWSEGMLLTPHHFQHWDHYYESLLTERVKALSPFCWGATSLDIDRDGLANGRFTLLGFDGVLPDGLVVRIPHHDSPPPTRQVGDLFGPTTEQLDVFLGIPVERRGGVNCRLEESAGARPARYTAEYSTSVDCNTGENPRDMLVARKNLRVVFSGEETVDLVSVKVAELIRTPSGAIGLQEAFIPPCLVISASTHLMKILRGLLELLTAKYHSFANPVRSLLETVGMDLGKYSLVSLLAEHLPLFTHFNHVGKVHPEVLYLALATFAGQLIVVAPAGESKDLPLYHHDNLGATFDELDRRIRMIIEGVTPTRYVTIDLEASGEHVWVGRVQEPHLFGTAQFFLMVSGEMSEDHIRTQVPQFMKMGSPSKLKEIVAAAMPGVRLYHTPRPPASLPVKVGYQFFRLDDRGVLWDEIRQSQVVAIHVPEHLHTLHIQLLAAKE